MFEWEASGYRDAELIVVGSGEHSWMSKVLVVSTATHLVKHADCPVVVVVRKASGV
jgi:nucleotide-binding universal stress UspA family protein